MKGKSVAVYAGILLLIVLMTGCQTTKAVPDGYFDYDLEQAEQAASQLDFNPELPKFIPIEMVMMVSDVYEVEGAEALDLSFYTNENDLLTLQFINGELEQDLFSSEEVEITASLSGQYVDNAFAKTVFWQKDGVTYKMTYRSSNYADSGVDVHKSDLINVARSFQF